MHVGGRVVVLLEEALDSRTAGWGLVGDIEVAAVSSRSVVLLLIGELDPDLVTPFCGNLEQSAMARAGRLRIPRAEPGEGFDG